VFLVFFDHPAWFPLLLVIRSHLDPPHGAAAVFAKILPEE
jgi:hypothetical protein